VALNSTCVAARSALESFASFDRLAVSADVLVTR
jgi:hypothetical protein